MTRAIASSKIQRIHDEEKSNHQQQAHFLPLAENRLARRNIPVEPPFIQIRVRKHDIALAIDYVALPILQGSWREMIHELVL